MLEILSLLLSAPCLALQPILISLRWTETSNPLDFSKPVQDLWRWKDACLGDGRDFFVPRPKTLRALQQVIQSREPRIRECLILSNCARFELMLVTEADVQSTVATVSEVLMGQVEALKKRSMPLPPFDWPAVIESNPPSSATDTTLDPQQHWSVLEDPADVSRHLCLIAAGMASRPRRPGRPTPFQPFSARDAHVLLQLKRTLDPQQPQCTRWLQYALQFGKRVRTVADVPEIADLRGTPSAADVERVTKIVKEKVLESAVQDFVQELQANELTPTIVSLRREAESLVNDEKELQWVRRELHEPTMAMRRGDSIELTALLRRIESDLVARREEVMNTTKL